MKSSIPAGDYGASPTALMEVGRGAEWRSPTDGMAVAEAMAGEPGHATTRAAVWRKFTTKQSFQDLGS